uniref:Platelet-derived growth factor (PDGF) family profile domain-containing protein n=1 Tax=Colobus angolensis palliatus TaxID=336983 RepID=A0A2K5J8Y4_COLAP
MPAMRLFPCFLQLLAGLALPAVPPQQWALSTGNGSSEVEVVPFQEVWGRSYCRALERLVDIVSEYPSEVEHMFSPSCVSLLRCTGCCGDENLHCVPVETVNVTMQLLKIRSGDRPSYVELTFSQHVRCECRHSPGRQSPDMPGDFRTDAPSLPPTPSGGCALTGNQSTAWPSCPVPEEIPRMHPGRKGKKPLREKMKPER